MNRKFLAGLILALVLSNGAVAETDQAVSDIYDEQLASELGADEYGMKSYVMVVLNTGPNDAAVTDKEEREKLFAGHFSNMDRLAEEDKLVFLNMK